MEMSYEDLNQKITTITNEKQELEDKLTKENSDLQNKIQEEREQMGEQFSLMKMQLEQKCSAQVSQFRDQIEGLNDIKNGYEKQIKQIEENNSDMQQKFASVQSERDSAKKIAEESQEKIEKFQKEIMNLELQNQQIIGEKSALDKQLEEELITMKVLKDKVDSLTENVDKLKQSNDTLSCNNEKYLSELSQALQFKSQNEELSQQISNLKSSNPSLKSSTANSADSSVTDPLDKRLNSENTDQLVSISQLENVKSLLNVKDEEIRLLKERLQEVQDKLHLETAISGDTDSKKRIKQLEDQLTSEQELHRQRIQEISTQYESQIMDKQLQCNVSLVNALEQQDNDTNALVKSQRETLKASQVEIKEKTAALDALKVQSQTMLKEKEDELCKFVQQYEDQIASIRTQHQTQLRNLEETWKTRTENLVKTKGIEMKGEIDSLKEDWNKERQINVQQGSDHQDEKELERLTQVAAAAFRSGTDSVELLKKQVASQRKELEEVKKNHKKEMQELHALLEVKRRRHRGLPAQDGTIRLGASLEEAAEFEYLRNILYQYMMGKETLTLAKVLCAVVKFDSKQEVEILEQEERKQTLLSKGENISKENIPPVNLDTRRSL